MTRTLRATALGALAAVAVALPAAPAQAAGPSSGTGAGITVRDSALELTPPLQTRPMDEHCQGGGFNHYYCGRVTLVLELAGFAAYGGIPACADPDGCSTDPALATFTGGRARVDVLVRCTDEWFPRVRSLPLVVQPGLGPSDVSPASRVDADAARLVFFADLPSPGQMGACRTGGTVLGAEVVRSLRLDFAGTPGGVPSFTTRLPGVHRVPLDG